jgi:hypothetical protein
MKSESYHETPDQEDLLDSHFLIRDLAPPDFAARTLAAVQEIRKRRRARLNRLGGWGVGVAASLALGLTLYLSGPTTEPEWAAEKDGGGREVTALAPVLDPKQAEAMNAAQYLNDLLYMALSGTEQAVLYAQAAELDTLLGEAIALADEESLYTLDMLILLAGG